MKPKIIVYPTTEPLTLAECRLHLRVDPTETDSDGNETHPDDALILGLLSAAREHCENFLGMTISPTTYELALDEFDGPVDLPWGPVNTVTSVTVGEESDALQDPATYVFDNFSTPARLVPVTTWPTGSDTNYIRIIYTAGFEDDSDSPAVPAVILAAIKLTMGYYYENREDVVDLPGAAQALLRPLRVRLGMA
jgi:uncharacterized phiE125 gp8 family phage protein